MAHAHLARGLLCERRRNLGGAQGDLERSYELARRGAGPVSEAWPLAHLARVRAARGERAAALEAVADARAALAGAPDGGIFGARVETAARALAARTRDIVMGDPLSDRELAVLRELAGPYARREIAERLFVSLNTVKSHTKSIFRKLGVSTREDAVTRARELELL
jgi:LuxR family maltose regulon positive regulatory protein